MLSCYLLAALLKSLKSRPSFSQIFDENIFIILGNSFWGLGDFFAKKAAKNKDVNNSNLKFELFQAQCRHTKVETWNFALLEVTWVTNFDWKTKCLK